MSAVYQHGKIPPQAVDLEQAILGAVMLESDAVYRAVMKMEPKMFYKEQHQKLFKAIQNLYKGGKSVDILTVTEQLKANGELEIAGGAYYLTQLTNRVASSANIDTHIHVVIQKFIARELIRQGQNLVQEAFEDTTDIFDLMDDVTTDTLKLYNVISGKSTVGIEGIVEENKEIVERMRSREQELIGVKSGFEVLDRFLLGFQKAGLYLIASRPGMGKTAFIMSLVRSMAVKNGTKVGVFSLEMSKTELGFRLVSSVSRGNYNKIRSGRMDEMEYEMYKNANIESAKAPIYIDDTPGLNYIQLRAKATELTLLYGIEIIFIDYVQLMSGIDNKGKNREQEISEISRNLKLLAKDMDIPVIALSQLSRSVELRGGMKRPELHDLRESGSLEQDADVVMFLYRPEYYKKKEDEDGVRFPDGYSELLLKKHRNGATGKIVIKFDKETMQFYDHDFPKSITEKKEMDKSEGDGLLDDSPF